MSPDGAPKQPGGGKAARPQGGLVLSVVLVHVGVTVVLSLLLVLVTLVQSVSRLLRRPRRTRTSIPASSSTAPVRPAGEVHVAA